MWEPRCLESHFVQRPAAQSYMHPSLCPSGRTRQSYLRSSIGKRLCLKGQLCSVHRCNAEAAAQVDQSEVGCSYCTCASMHF